jgi:hypothetical protein
MNTDRKIKLPFFQIFANARLSHFQNIESRAGHLPSMDNAER